MTTAQQQQALQMSVGLFNAAPGATYMNQFANYLATPGATMAGLVYEMTKTTAFQALYPSYMTNDAFAAAFCQRLLGSTVDSATMTWAVAQVTSKAASAGFGGAASWAYQALAAVPTTDASFGKAVTAFNNKVDVANYYTVTKGGNATDLGSLQATVVNVTDSASSVTSAKATIDNSTTSGQTFTLTTALDVVAGTAGDDTILGDFAGTPTLNAGDQINGGAGTDTLKMYGETAALLASNMPISIQNVEIVEFASGIDNNHQDFSALTKAATGIEQFKIGNASLLNAKTITTTAGQALSLATGAGSVATAGTVTWAASNTDTSATLTLNGYQGGRGVAPAAVTITGSSTGTVNVASKGSTNQISTFTLPATTTKLVVTGDQALNITANLISGASATTLQSVDASANTGGVSTKLAAATAATFAFTGGAGNDGITLADNGLAALTAGSQLDGGAGTDKLGIFDTALTAAEFTALNAAKNFEVLGLNAAITLDASKLSSIKSFSLDTAAIKTISNMATGATVTASVDDTNTLTFSGATGVNDLALTLGSARTTDIDLTAVTIGQTTVALSSLGAGTANNTITTLSNADNSVYTVTGNNNLTITNALAATSTGSKVDANAFTGQLSVLGSAKSDVLIGGSSNDTIDGGNITMGVPAATEVDTADFASGTTHAQSSTIVLGGITVTVTASGGATGAEIAAMFASLANGASANTSAKATATGTLTGWTTGALHDTDQITFTSTSTNSTVTAIANTGTATITGVTRDTTGTNGTAQSMDTLTGNGGSDTFKFSTADLGTAVASAAVTQTITDFTTGVDKIKDTTIGAAGSSTNYVAATSAAASMAALLTAADTALDGTVKYYVGQYGSDTYLIDDANGTGMTNVIKLAGVSLTGIAASDIIA